MKQTTIFLKKELIESWRTYRVLILLVAFLFFGMLSPLTAKFMPQIMEEFLPEGLTISLPEPSYVDSWLQFFKNMSQMGLLVIIILFAGLLVDEYQKHSLPMLLTKGLKSHAIIHGKFIATSSLVTLTYLTGFLVCLLYTWIYFQTRISTSIFVGALSLLLVYFLVIALFLFWGALFSKMSGVLLSTVICLGVMLIANIHPSLQSWNPISLLNTGTTFIQGNAKFTDFIGAYIVTILMILCLLGGSIKFLKNKEI